MAMGSPPVLYQEARISPAPHSPASVLTIRTSSRNATNSAGRKRAFDEISGLDEEQYAKRYLATEGSVFFRSPLRFPRSFLWRVLNDRKLLEIQCVDLVQRRTQAKEDRWLTFRIEFKDAILEKGVAFADADDSDALEIFVMTQSNELFTVTLKRDLLMRETAPSDFDATTCVKQFTSNPLTFRHPYRLFATNSSRELFISLSDGGFVQFHRKAGENGTQWRETFFNEGGLMGTLRGLNPLKRRQTVRYGSLELEPGALAEIVKSPDGKHVWTISLDHVLRAWSTETWKVVHTMDLLGERLVKDGAREKRQYVMNAEPGTLLQIVAAPPPRTSRALAQSGTGAETYALIIHSPKDHQIKFYQVQPGFSSTDDGDAVVVNDLREGSRMIPPVEELMNTNLWQLQQFHVQPGPGWTDTHVWLRARSGALCRTFMLTIDLSISADDELEGLWRNGWIAVDQGPTTADRLKDHSAFPGDLEAPSDSPATPSEKWQAFLFYPERFSQASLEAALHIYRTGRGLASNSNRTNLNDQHPLEERLVTSIASKVTLRSLPNRQPDYDGYQNDIAAQWHVFYSLLSHLHARRNEPLALAYDSIDQLSWSVCADFVAPIRMCSAVERRYLNASLLDAPHASPVLSEALPTTDDQLYAAAKLLGVAREFRQGLSATFKEKLGAIALTEAAAVHTVAPAEHAQRVQALFDTCGFEYEVSDDDFDALNLATEAIGGLGSVDNNAPFVILDWLDREGDVSGSDDARVLNRFGVKFTVAAAQETLELSRSILLDLLALIVFMAGGLEESELDPGFRPGDLYAAILVRLKLNEVSSWLAAHVRQEGSAKLSPPADEQEAAAKTITLLEDVFIGDWRAVKVKHASLAEHLTLWSKAWVAGPDLQQNWDGVTAHIMGSLLRYQNIDLALDFQRFLTPEPWPTYLLGRLHLATGDYALASIHFQAAASTLSEQKKIDGIDTAGLLSAEERNSFGNGSSRYYLHVTGLYEQLKNYSYTADFANLALQDPSVLESDFRRSIAELDRKKSRLNSPAKDKMDHAIEELRLLKVKELRDEILNRLFNALVQTGHFRNAYDALEKIQDPPVRRSEMKKLIETCVKQDDVPTLLRLPFSAELADTTDKILLDLAKRGLSSAAVIQHTPYHQILYSFRIQRGNFRGAAEILFELLERLRLGSNNYHLQNPEDETLPEIYVLLINTLTCCGEDNSWLLAEAIQGLHAEDQKRRLVTIADIRREYAAELDKRSEMMQGRFPMVAAGAMGGDDMDVL